MSASSPITINDGQATPVSKTFNPSKKDGATVFYQNRATGNTANGFEELAISQNRTVKSSVIKQRITGMFPIEVLDSTTGTYSYPAIGRFTIDVLIPVIATAAHRANYYAYLKNLVSHAVIQSLVKDLDPPF